MRIKILLPLIILFGLAVRFLYFDRVTFEWDQARDAFQALSIWQGDPIKIIGANTDLPGLHHGPLYWYLISPFYFFSKGNVYAVRMFTIVLSIVNIILAYLFASKLFKDKTAGIFAAILMATSLESVEYARWLSNPAPAILTVGLSFYGLWMAMEKKEWGIPLFLSAWFASIHFQFLLVYQALMFLPLLFFVLKRNKLSIRTIFASIASFVFLLPFIAAELKFKFQGIKALSVFFLDEKPLFIKFSGILEKFTDRVVHAFYFNVAGINILFAGVLAIFVLGYAWMIGVREKKFKKETLFLFLWLISPVFIFAFDQLDSYYSSVGMAYPVILLSAFVLRQLQLRNKLTTSLTYLVLLVCVITQLSLVLKQNQKGEMLFSIQNKMELTDEKKVVDWIYKKANGANFALNTVTNPLYITTTWAYLFDWYGKGTYGYLPSWWGYPQDGVIGSNVSFSELKKPVSYELYLIIEPPPTPEPYVFAFTEFEQRRTKLVERVEIGGFIVERRKITINKPFSRDEIEDLARSFERLNK